MAIRSALFARARGRGSAQSSLVRRRFISAGVRPGAGVMHGRRVMVGRRGGFFGSVFKAVKKVASVVTKVPVVSQIAKVAISSLPVVGQVVTAVNAVKKFTPQGIAPSAGFAKLSATPGPSTPLAAQISSLQSLSSGGSPAKKRKKKAKKKAKKPRKKAKAKRKAASKKGTAKQRAARARFARAAKKGRIKKGQKL